MKNKKFLFLSFCILLSGPACIKAQEAVIPEQIPLAIQKGDARMLAGHFNEAIELTLLDKEAVYSREQAERIMKDFFLAHPPVQFSIKHQGGKSQSRYAIGQLQTQKERYRVYFLIKWEEGKAFIHQLRIETDNG